VSDLYDDLYLNPIPRIGTVARLRWNTWELRSGKRWSETRQFKPRPEGEPFRIPARWVGHRSVSYELGTGRRIVRELQANGTSMEVWSDAERPGFGRSSAGPAADGEEPAR
jgi:hypothetical protein